MSRNFELLSVNLPPWEKRVIGKSSTEWVVRRADCTAFDDFGLVEIGHVEACRYYRAARADWPFTMVIICSSGLGTVRSGEQRFQLGPGQALLLPPQRPHDFQASKIGWGYTVLNYHSGSLVRQNIGLPRLVSIHAQPLEAMILAFRREYQSDQDPALLRQMLEIIQTKILRLFNPAQNASRLWPLWSAVLEHPEFNWTIEALTQRAHLSGEHLRRTCQSDLGRSPMGQVTWLRLKVAASRLTVGDEVIEEIAHQVGFESERAFRSAFTKMFQCTPTQYRQKTRLIMEELNSDQGVVDRSLNRADPGISTSVQTDYDALGSRSVHSVSLRPFANSFFSRDDRPWFGDIPLQIPLSGIHRIHGVPFHILNQNEGPSFILMKSGRLEKTSRGRKLPSTVQISLHRCFRKAYFLHACGWGTEFGLFASYRFIYTDKSVVEIPLIVLSGTHPEEVDGSKANIQDWHFSWEQLNRPYAKPHDVTSAATPTQESQYLYTLEWTNPRPDKKLAFLEIKSDPARKATLAVLALSLL
jgi:AraC-like DNA-binding protein